MKYIDFNDEKLPIGKRKQAYIKWAVSKGTDIEQAKKQANRKFGFEKKPGIIALVTDYSGRMQQRSFTGSEEIFFGIDLRKYEKHHYEEVVSDEQVQRIKKKAAEKGWDVIEVGIHS
jgi:hypothetical protein